jgi:aryl-alcohol dehydrogenase-like predicted oxidoreductase
MALRWILSFPGITTAIPGARTPQQAEENARAADLGPLDAEAMAAVKAVYDRRLRATIHSRW